MSQLHRHPAPGALQGVQGVGDSSEQDVNVSLGDDGRVELPGWHPVGRERPDGPVRGVAAGLAGGQISTTRRTMATSR